MPKDVEREYTYRPGWMMILLGGGFFTACALFIGIKACGNQEGLVINGILQLGPNGATIFYWILCGLSIGFVAIAGMLIFHRLACDQRIAFTSNAILLPASPWSKEETTIPFNEIVKLASAEVSGQRFLYLYRNNNTKFTITGSLLPSKQSFDEIHTFLETKIQSSAMGAG